MTTGEKLKSTLGLDKLRYVYICRVLISSYRVHYVFYDSRRKTTPITNQRALRGYMPSTLQRYPFRKRPVTTPLTDIEDFNGPLNTGMFFAIDLAGQYGDQRNLTNIIEDNKLELGKASDHNQAYVRFFGKLSEFVSFNDLLGDKGLSDFTKNTRQQRNKVSGTENRLAKLIDIDVDKPNGSITFKWLTPATEPIYPKDYDYKSVNPNNLGITGNRSKTYELWIKILDFFEWLSVFEGEEITNKEIKEILEISNIQIWSDDVSFQYQGINYWMSQLDGSIFPTSIAPKRWNAPHLHGDGNAFLSKHIAGLINNIKFWYNPMASMLNKKLKDFNLR